jgi:hypothetical protein
VITATPIARQAGNGGSSGYANNPATGLPYGAVDNAGAGGATGVPSGQSGNNPIYSTPQGAGLPTAAQVAALAPPSVTQFGALPSVDPTYANAATVDPNQNKQYIQQYEQLMQQSLQPTFAQQDQQLQDSNAARGISSSGAAGYLQGNLLGQQGATLAGADAPIVQQGYGYTQQDIAQNQANQQQVNVGNAAASNAADNTNAGYYAAAVGSNQSAYDQFLSQLYGTGAGLSGTEESAYLNSFGPNTGVQGDINTAEAGAGQTFQSAYGNASSLQGAALGLGAEAAGAGFGGGAAATPMMADLPQTDYGGENGGGVY